MSAYPQRPHDHGSTRFGAAVGLFWFFLTAGLAMTAALLVLGGAEIVEATSVRITMVVAVAVFAVHSARQYRHSGEPIEDERLQRARERRGF
jgi:hypothetical protein